MEGWQQKWRAEGGNTNIQDVFFTPTWYNQGAWGEPAVNFHNGLYTLIYDYFPGPQPFVLATSQDGVYWQDQGPVFEKDDDVKDIECAYIERFRSDGPWVMQYAFQKPGATFRMRFATSDDLVHWTKCGPAATFSPDPGGVFSAEMFWMNGKHKYYFPLLKKVEREGDSLWLKWWKNNEILKARRLALSAPAKNIQAGGRRFDLPERLDLSRGTIIEGMIRLPPQSSARKNLALGAVATAAATKQDSNKTAAGLQPQNAVDGLLCRGFAPDYALTRHGCFKRPRGRFWHGRGWKSPSVACGRPGGCGGGMRVTALSVADSGTGNPMTASSITESG